MWSSRRFHEGFFNYEDAYASVDVGAMSSATGTEAPVGAPASAPVAATETSYTQPSFAPAPVPVTTSYNPGQIAAPTAAAPTVAAVASSTGVTLSFLTDLMNRIDEESAKLYTLNEAAPEPTVIAKINQLSLMRDQLAEYMNAFRRSQISLEEIPITPEAAENFLRSLGRPTAAASEYPGLFKKPDTEPNDNGVEVYPKNIRSKPSTSLGSLGSFDFQSMEDLQGMFKYLQDIKWRFELSYDPSLSQKTDLLDRLESLEKRIMAYVKEGVAMPDSVKQVLSRELDLLTTIIKNSKQQQDRSQTYTPRQTTQHTRMSSSTTYRPNDGRTYSIPVEYRGVFDGTPEDSPDVRIRPGFVLTDEQIRHRASAAAFNTQAVGGPDYKKRSEELCRQIRGANIGTPADFGCIENPNEVSANYSWKGNYTMICSRLGDTWGSWYPAMFGCPKTGPDDRYNGNLL